MVLMLILMLILVALGPPLAGEPVALRQEVEAHLEVEVHPLLHVEMKSNGELAKYVALFLDIEIKVHNSAEAHLEVEVHPLLQKTRACKQRCVCRSVQR